MNQKVEITKYVINKLGLISPSEKSFKAWIHTIWQNPRLSKNNGYRLTQRGFDLLIKSEIKHYEVRLENEAIYFENKFILWLDNKFKSPFFLTKEKIYFFNEKPAVQLVLFSGDLQKLYSADIRFAEKQQAD